MLHKNNLTKTWMLQTNTPAYVLGYTRAQLWEQARHVWYVLQQLPEAKISVLDYKAHNDWRGSNAIN